jgi:type II secretory pathway pseudopilin PulG
MTHFPRRLRPGFTLIEALVALGVVIVVVLLSIPLVYRGVGSMKRRNCEFNLHHIGQSLDQYKTSFAGQLPIGSRYQQTPDSPFGPSWWVSLLPFTDQGAQFKSWKNLPSSGRFDLAGKSNENIKLADGFRPTFMFCPTDPLPQGNDPMKNISAENRALLSGPAQGIPVSSYVAIAGSAPDMTGGGTAGGPPSGRNTKEGKYGILSGSGVFPPNQNIREAAIRDGKSFTLAFGEQSNIWLDASYDPPVPYDLRSGWPGGAFMGSGGNYSQLSPTAEGIDGTGDMRALNITTIRYPVNDLGLKAGMFSEPLSPIPPPKEGDPPRPPPVKRPPGPGHNHGLFSAHGDGAQGLMVDGTVRWLSSDMELRVLLLLSTRDDGQVMPNF